MLRATNIHHQYGDLSILNNVSLSVKKGEIVSIVGSSGAGKTTLLQILGTLERPTSGTFTIDGISPLDLSKKKLAAFRNQSIGFIFQFHQLLPEFTALENILLPGLIGGSSISELTPKAKELMEILNISHRSEHKPSELSGGEQQRIAVARSLINSPKIIFADEPSGNLDSKNAEELHRLFFELRDRFQQTFVIVTHNESLAGMSDRKLFMRDGKFDTSS
ncbi:MAG: ABC transporter ATP-binding protein [Crocinitomicaceae bacterium]|nr:ABC transporter ATP-binding protein [Crocinitomicaceae bacterium]